MSQDELRHFFCGEHPYAVEYGRDLVERYDFSSYNTLLDVGGGSGGLAIAVTEACPNIKATVVDLPKVTPVTQHYIDEAGAGSTVTGIHDENSMLWPLSKPTVACCMWNLPIVRTNRLYINAC
jgi:hypothetical protein